MIQVGFLGDLVLWMEVRLLVGVSGGECGWSRRKLAVGTWAGFGVGVGLNNRGEELQLIYSKLHLWGMHSVTERNSVNWLYGVGTVVLCQGGSDSVSGEIIDSSL